MEIVWPGDVDGNGLLRKVVYPLPFGGRGELFELVKKAVKDGSYDYVILSRRAFAAPCGSSMNRIRERARREQPGRCTAAGRAAR